MCYSAFVHVPLALESVSFESVSFRFFHLCCLFSFVLCLGSCAGGVQGDLGGYRVAQVAHVSANTDQGALRNM